ncbi:hypothetical protein BMH28_10435, partial [Leucobacter sp. OLCS4]
MPNLGSPSHDRDDPALLEASRAGDTAAFAELWSRHSAAGRVAARSLAPHLDADDLVSEAYLKILALVRDGRGPTGAFRPYLYRVIKTTAADMDRGSVEQDAEPEMVPTPESEIPGADEVFDHDTVARAFTTLNERWQAVLWYTEVEGLPPREIASILGVSPNGVSALAVRARKALRTAWIDAHVEQDVVSEECASTRKLLQRYGQHRLTPGKRRAVEAHLDDCAACRSASEELRVLDLDLARTLAIALLGFGGTGALLAALGHGTAAAGGTAAAAALGSSAGSGATGAAGAGATGGASGAVGGGATAATSTGLLAGVATPVAIVATVGVAAAAAITGAVMFSPTATGSRPTEPSSSTAERTPGRSSKPASPSRSPERKPTGQPTTSPAPSPNGGTTAEAVAAARGAGDADGQQPAPSPTPPPGPSPSPG